jgi:intein/homing endonuclease
MENRAYSALSFQDYLKIISRLRVYLEGEVGDIISDSGVLKKLGLPSYTESRYRNARRAFPLAYIQNEPELLEEIMHRRPDLIMHGGVRIFLPIEVTPEISYLAGFISGDGNLFLSEKRDYIVSLHNKETTLLMNMIEIVRSSFGYDAAIRKGHGCSTVEIRSAVIHTFFNRIMEIESGRKKAIKIPEKIKSDRKLIRSFIAGFFDAEGCVALQKNMKTCQISISQKQKGILDEIKAEMEKDGIMLTFYDNGSGCFRMYGNKDSLRPFSEKIPFMHPKKRQKLMTALMNS